MGIIDDIIDGNASIVDVVEHNIWVMSEKIRLEKKNVHREEDCLRRYCHHGNPQYIRSLEGHLEFLKSQLEDNPQ